jgi:hypothetical protein
MNPAGIQRIDLESRVHHRGTEITEGAQSKNNSLCVLRVLCVSVVSLKLCELLKLK